MRAINSQLAPSSPRRRLVFRGLGAYSDLAGAAVTAAQAVADFANSNSGYCSMVGFTQVVHDFKNAWNASWSAPDAPQPAEPQLAHNGMYDAACANAVNVSGVAAPATCPGALPPLGGGGGGGPPQPPPPPGPTPTAATSTNYTVPILIGAGVVAAGAITYAATRTMRRRSRRYRHA